jgi:SSS family solute:Na+ symporter
VSLITRPRKESELAGLVYSLTPRNSERYLPWYQRPAVLGVVVLTLALILNIIFW